jgi:hypothetical protein
MKIRLRKPSPAMVVACISLFIGLGGTSFAAVTLARNSVLSKHIKNGQVKRADLGANAVNSAKVGDGSLLAQDFAAGQLPAGPQGVQGLQGPPGVNLWAVVNSDGTLARSKGVTSAARIFIGQYRLTFNQNVDNCAYSATIRVPSTYHRMINAQDGPALNQLEVHTTTEVEVSQFIDAPFYVIVAC